MTTTRLEDRGISTERIGAGPPLLLVHGGLVDRRSWVHQRVLAGELTLLLPDTRGFGQSSRARAAATPDDLVDDVSAVVAAAGFDAVHLLGFSLGGMIAQAVAVRRPELVRSLVLVSTCMPPTASRGGAPRAQPSPDAHVTRAFSESFRASHAEFLASYRAMANENRARGFTALAPALRDAASADQLGELTVPTLVIHADDDAAIPIRLGERLAAAIPSARLQRFAGCGHSVHIERPTELNELVGSFVSRVEG
ncbi:MAG: alpha/beta hydrolase fold protein [Acidimicrobiales bacterium]|nr:alpha/beta hydrolase fold protein [Acidimicrobiales bacterium]